MKLLSTHNQKILKSIRYGYLTGILHLSPANISGYNVCKFATNGCRALCLNKAGRGRYARVQNARIRKTRLLHENRQEFMSLLRRDLFSLEKKANKKGLKPTVRLDGTSDLGLAVDLIKEFPNIQFYDYTKDPIRYRKWLKSNSNYHLTFSRSEKNDKTCLEILSNGGNVAVVFESLPETWNGYRVIDGDESDLRFLDPCGVVVGLKLKKVGKPKNEFVYQD